MATSLPVRWLKVTGTVETTATDINMNGLFLRMEDLPKVRSLMQLEVTLPMRVLRFFAVARFVGNTESGPGIGVEIHLIDEHDRAVWHQYYRALLSRASKAPSPALARASIR